MWKLWTNCPMCAPWHCHTIASFRHHQLFQGDWRTSTDHWLSRRVLSTSEPGVLQGRRRCDPSAGVPVQASWHKVGQLHVIAVVESGAKWPRRRNTADFAASRLAGCQLTHAVDSISSAIPTASRQVGWLIILLQKSISYSSLYHWESLYKSQNSIRITDTDLHSLDATWIAKSTSPNTFQIQ